MSAAVLCKPAPNPTPISVYQQGEVDPQEYQQQYRRPIQYKQQLVQQVRPATRTVYKGQEQDPNQQTESEDYEVCQNMPPVSPRNNIFTMLTVKR